MTQSYLLSAFTPTDPRYPKHPVGVDKNGIDPLVRGRIETLKSDELITVENTNFGVLAVRMTEKGSVQLGATTREEWLTEVGSGTALEADRALWAWVLRNGGASHYHDSAPRRTEAKFLHVLVCGLDLDATGSVQDETWSTFAGTYEESDESHGLGGYVTCRCGEINRYQVITTVTSIADVIRGALSI